MGLIGWAYRVYENVSILFFVCIYNRTISNDNLGVLFDLDKALPRILGFCLFLLLTLVLTVCIRAWIDPESLDVLKGLFSVFEIVKFVGNICDLGASLGLPFDHVYFNALAEFIVTLVKLGGGFVGESKLGGLAQEGWIEAKVALTQVHPTRESAQVAREIIKNTLLGRQVK